MSESQVKYSEILPLLAVKDINGKIHKPISALVKYDDGWRMFAIIDGLGDNLRTTSYPINPKQALKNLGID